ITARDVVTVLGVVEEQTALGFADAVITRDVAGCLALVSRVVDEGKDLRQVMRTLIDHLRDLLVVKTGSRDADLIDTTEARLAALATQAEHTTIEDVLRVLNILSGTEGESRWSPQPRLLLEIALIRLCRPEMDPTVEGLRARVQAIEHRLGGAPDPAPPASAPPTPAKPPEVPRRRPTQSRPAGQEDVKAEVTVASGAAVATADAEPAGVPVMVIEDVRRQWARVLEEVKRTKMFCHALLIEGMPLRLEGSTLVIGLRTGYNFHAEDLPRPENRSVGEGAGRRDLGKMMKQAQKLQQDVARLQEELKAERVEATAGGGVVRAIANGHGELQEITIDPSVVNPSDVGLLQDLVVAAVGEAQRLAKQKAEERMRGLTGGLPLPPGMI